MTDIDTRDLEMCATDLAEELFGLAEGSAEVETEVETERSGEIAPPAINITINVTIGSKAIEAMGKAAEELQKAIQNFREIEPDQQYQPQRENRYYNPNESPYYQPGYGWDRVHGLCSPSRLGFTRLSFTDPSIGRWPDNANEVYMPVPQPSSGELSPEHYGSYTAGTNAPVDSLPGIASLAWSHTAPPVMNAELAEKVRGVQERLLDYLHERQLKKD